MTLLSRAPTKLGLADPRTAPGTSPASCGKLGTRSDEKKRAKSNRHQLGLT
jgi:hypothetical protein